MKKLIIALVPLLLLSCGNKPVSTSESTNSDIDSTEPSISTVTTTTSISTSSKAELRLPSTYSLQRVLNGINYPSFTIEFVNKADCLVKWSLDGTEYMSHQTYSIKYDQNILYDAIWDMVYFKPNLMEGPARWREAGRPRARSSCGSIFYSRRRTCRRCRRWPECPPHPK